MSMIKIVEPDSWQGEGFDNPAQLVKVSSRGLIGNDRADFLKSASHVFANMIDNIALQPGDIPIHLNAIGATEAYGSNRNGDGFGEHYCKSAHARFVSGSRYYRNHQNKNPAKSYGCVKLSTYNEPMRRIELLLLGNGDEKAAQRNGGLPMLKTSVDKLHRGESLPFSMACKIAFDVCQNCFNKAANRTQYCDESTCIGPSGRRGFGCKHGLTKVASDGLQQYVENPDPFFFDISEVVRPADRIAYGGLADYMQKAACGHHVVGGAELADLWARDGADFGLISEEATIFNRAIRDQIKLARSLADLELAVESGEHYKVAAWGARALNVKAHQFEDPASLGEPGSEKLASSLAALAEQKILLPLPAFLHISTGGDAEKIASLSATVPRHLPGVFSRLLSDPNLESAVRANKFAHSREPVTAGLRERATKQADACSLARAAVTNRIWKSAINRADAAAFVSKEAMIKTAAADNPDEAYARQYALYKLAFLNSVPRDSEYSLIKQLTVVQNYLSSD